jgi:hypothetical protein
LSSANVLYSSPLFLCQVYIYITFICKMFKDGWSVWTLWNSDRECQVKPFFTNKLLLIMDSALHYIWIFVSPFNDFFFYFARFQHCQLKEMTQQSGEVGNGWCSSQLKAWQSELSWSAGCQSTLIQLWQQDGYIIHSWTISPCYVLVCVTHAKALLCYWLCCFKLSFLWSILANDFACFLELLI